MSHKVVGYVGVDAVLHGIGAGDLDVYDVLAAPKNADQRVACGILESMIERVSQHQRLHPDDQFEEICDIVADELAIDYP